MGNAKCKSLTMTFSKNIEYENGEIPELNGSTLITHLDEEAAVEDIIQRGMKSLIRPSTERAL